MEVRSEWVACTITENTAGGVNQVCVCVCVCGVWCVCFLSVMSILSCFLMLK